MTSPESYNPNVPLGQDFLAVSQSNFLANFQQLYDAFSENHVALDAISGAGNHSIVQLLEQTKAYQTGIGELTAYTKDAPDQTDQIFLRYQGNGQEIQYTNYQLYNLGTGFNFFTFLPGRILVYFGLFTSKGRSQDLILLPPVAKNIMTVNCCIGEKSTAPLPAPKPDYLPTIAIPAAENGFFKKITFNSTGLGNLTDRIVYYFVLANI